MRRRKHPPGRPLGPGETSPTGRCDGCWLLPTHCVCGLAQRVELPLRVVVIRHYVETLKSSNSARLGRLVLKDYELRDHPGGGNKLDLADLAAPGTGILFPAEDGCQTIEPAALSTLVVPDGTWRQARRMVRRTPELAALPRVSFEVARAAPRVLTPPADGAMSTLEAIAATLELLGYTEPANNLLELYDAFVVANAVQKGQPPPGQ